MIPLIATLLCLFAAAPSQPDIEVTEDRQVFTLFSALTGEWQVSRTMTVNTEVGLEDAMFYMYGDSFRSLKSFSGTITPANAKPVKVKMSDLQKVSISQGLVDDGVHYAYLPSGHFPLTVHYEYKVAFRNGFASFPTFYPVMTEKMAVKNASYTLDVPAGYSVRYAASRLQFQQSSQKDRDLYQWTLDEFEPYVEESLMPSERELVPYLHVAPGTINLGGFEGSQSNWNDFGSWVYQLQKDRAELTPEEVSRIKALTADCSSPLEKLIVLYDYLREHTRYVSIQLGIGGFRPIAAQEVSRMGFGDCKGLSNYLHALLKAVDVPSDYYVISTKRASFLGDYSSADQMNHAMLAVPVPELSDTVWVECTNPSVPLGYRHANAAGHQVLLIKESGGELVRIPSYPDSLSKRFLKMSIELEEDGSALVKASQARFLDYAEDCISFRNLSPQQQINRLTSNLIVHADRVTVDDVRDNFRDYPQWGRNYVPRVDLDYHFRTGTYAKKSGSRLFVPVNPNPRQLTVQSTERVNDVCRGRGCRYEDDIQVSIPEGYRPEGIPKDMVVDSEWGTLTSTVTLSEDGRTMLVHQALILKPFRAPASAYPSYRDFARAVSRAYNATAVFVK